ncbi:tRNA-(ms[2]io[6]A)-hydroxylase [Paraperlucidibaca wandonensis]|jgi:tRNA-(ms[2]io[6]A)-hydroxylase|uniref:tRNA-(Ms[2]io[6]A)-hydroxylase n=1 Tax=Paraperlucidibaca wandonensis TaxID=1268273 RepID=A0ABW3HH69_9GAMM
MSSDFLQPVRDFLGAATTDAWVQAAVADLPTLLQDHANCEKKAASTALNMLFRYNDREQLQTELTQLAREELLHYEQVRELMAKRGISYRPLSASRYANGMRQHVRTYEPAHLVDLMIIGAFVEARSCERFAAVAEYLDDELKRFYSFLLRSEARHFTHYLGLAQCYSSEPIAERVAFFREVEAELISTPDVEMRFHSGVPQIQVQSQTRAQA